ncbi:type VI secretion system-associated protein TagK, partial [Salmonella enterica subsp. enterica serovar Corvallis]
DMLDTTGEGEMHWLAMESMPDTRSRKS